MKAAQVIVKSQSFKTDKIYSYSIPESLQGQITRGVRVAVPFGGGNRKVEGVVLDVCDGEFEYKLKNILKVLDEHPLVNDELLSLALWIKKEYFCTYYDAVKAVFPPGYYTKMDEYISLNTDISEEEILKKIKSSKAQVDIYNVIKEGETEYGALCTKLNKKTIRSTINLMVKKEILKINHIEKEGVHDKTVKAVHLAVNYDDAVIFIEQNFEKAPVQALIVEQLLSNDYIAMRDIEFISGRNYGAIKSLENKGIIETGKLVVERYAAAGFTEKEPCKELTREQSAVTQAIGKYLNRREHHTFLLHGVTGSGKTEVYMNIIRKAIANKQQAIVLVPEISLTPQMVSSFKHRFGDDVAVFHSGLSLGQRYDEWKKIKDGRVSVAVGARSAIFAPFDNLAVIVVDEEHETSYKSEHSPKYNAIDIAKKRGEINGAVVILASATPSVVSYYKALNGEYTLLSMNRRFNNNPLPEIAVVDMRKELEHGNKTIFSRKLYDEISQNIQNKEQTILFLNRRGYSTFVSCRNCGYVAKCPNCDISLTYHSKSNTLHCHYCGYRHINYRTCPECNSPYIKYFGAGTQKLEEEIKRCFPEASVLRMDADTTASKFSFERILNKFRDENFDILIGTQMVSKGLDFPNVTLVGVVSADTMLNIDDFKCAERTFSQIMQVCGRAGRHKKEGRSVVQTYNPEHYAIEYAKSNDYKGFYENEILFRKGLNYPPYCDIINIILSGENEDEVKVMAESFNKLLYDMCSHMVENKEIEIIRPHKSPLSFINLKHRMRIIIKTKVNLNDVLNDVLNEYHKFKTDILLSVDINPVNMF